MKHLSQTNPEGIIHPEPERILDRRIFKKGQRAGVELLIQWTQTPENEATWKDREELLKIYPALDLEYEVI